MVNVALNMGSSMYVWMCDITIYIQPHHSTASHLEHQDIFPERASRDSITLKDDWVVSPSPLDGPEQPTEPSIWHRPVGWHVIKAGMEA